MRYNDLADAVEHFKELGFTHTFKLKGDKIICEEQDRVYLPENLKIIESYRHEIMTDPGSDETVFAIESDKGIKGILIAAFGMYVEPEKAKIISKLLHSHKYK